MRLPGSILQGILARAALTVLRIYLGIALLVSAVLRLNGGFPAELTEMFPRGVLASGPLWYQQFAEQLILPRIGLVAALITWGELVMGCCLVLGLGTRLVAALALLLALNLMLAEGSSFWTRASSYPGWAVVSLALLIGAAGRTLGVDAVLAKRWPRSPFW